MNTDTNKLKNNTETVSLKELRETFYRLRDFEISNLWQRSVFLSAILVLLFTGYGCTIVKEADACPCKMFYYNLLSLAISLVGLCFSCLWIMMAKGSKMWYEVYEQRIYEIERELELNIPEQWRMETPKKIKDMSNWLFSTKAGKYSVSRINIIIGQAMFVIWSFAILVHLVLLCYCMSKPSQQLFIMSCIVLVTTPVLFCLIVHILPHSARSHFGEKRK